jgi:hypothetical protein
MAAFGKYVNPFTDFGFKRLFGEEAHKNLLQDFNEIPTILNEPIFQEAFEVARVANFDQKELDQYQESCMIHNDLNNVINSAVHSAVDKKVKEIIIKNLKRGKLTMKEIAEDSDVSLELVLAIQKELKRIIERTK